MRPLPALSASRHIYAISDVHTDYAENMRWIESLSDDAFQSDVLICAGDVADRISTFKHSMELLVSKFALVFYTPGNHELCALYTPSHISLATAHASARAAPLATALLTP